MVEGKQDFGFRCKMTQRKSDNVNGTQDDIGTTGIELVCLLYGIVRKIRDASSRGSQSFNYLWTECDKQTPESYL